MKSKSIILLALAIGCGLVAAFLTAKLGASNKTEMVPVLVAAKNLDQGLKLDEPEKLFVRKPFPPESVPQEYINDLAALKGKVLQRTVRPGSTIGLADITPPKSLVFPVRADGMPYKAMGVKVAPEIVAGGLVNPGDHVDVISVERYQNGKVSSIPVLQNVLVVAVNAIAQLPDGQDRIKDAATVTVAVTLKEAQILTLADSRGAIKLLLRSKDDQTKDKGAKAVEGYNKQDDEQGPGAADGGVQTAKVPVPKKTIEPGTKIENPDEFFEEKEFRQADLPATTVLEMAELKGQTLKGKAYAGIPVVKEVFEGDLPKPGDAGTATVVKAAPTAKMVFQVGTAAPQYFYYDEKGRLLEDGGKAPTPAPPPPPPSPTTKLPDSPAIKQPEEADKDKESKN